MAFLQNNFFIYIHTKTVMGIKMFILHRKFYPGLFHYFIDVSNNPFVVSKIYSNLNYCILLISCNQSFDFILLTAIQVTITSSKFAYFFISIYVPTQTRGKDLTITIFIVSSGRDLRGRGCTFIQDTLPINLF